MVGEGSRSYYSDPSPAIFSFNGPNITKVTFYRNSENTFAGIAQVPLDNFVLTLPTVSVDTTSPTITFKIGNNFVTNYQVTADPGKNSVNVIYSAMAVDDDGSNTEYLLLISGLHSGSEFPIGTTVNTFETADVAGNIATATLTITVVAADPVDTDGDGINDDVDACPTQAETFNGYQDTDGCPDTVPILDTDGDGINDDVDACPTQAETFNGYQDTDGCPDTVPILDTDGDGINDDVDACPIQAETFNGYQDTDGCPDTVPILDTDGDGVPDTDDGCPYDQKKIESGLAGCGNVETLSFSGELSGSITTDVQGNTIISGTDNTGTQQLKITIPQGATSDGNIQVTYETIGQNNAVEITGVKVPYLTSKSIEFSTNTDSNKVCIIDSSKSVLASGIPNCDTTNTSIYQVVMDCSINGVTKTYTGFPESPTKRTYTCTTTSEGYRVDGLVNCFVMGVQHHIQVPENIQFLFSFGSSIGPEDEQLRFPPDVAVDDSGKIFVPQYGPPRMKVFDSFGKFLGETPTVGNIVGLAFDSGKIYATDGENFAIRVFDAEFFNELEYITNPVFTRTDRPVDVAIYSNKMYITTSANGIKIIDTSGKLVKEFGKTGSGNGEFLHIRDIATDDSGKFYVADLGNHRIQIFDSLGNFDRAFGEYGQGDGQFDRPIGIAVDSGKIYVAEIGNKRVQIFDTSGKFIQKFDTKEIEPYGIDVHAGKIYVPHGHPGIIEVYGVAGYDTDNDGIIDTKDSCPKQAETFNGYQDTDGCPDTVPILDTDGDGINDDVDACPTQAETFNGYQDTDGCPDTVPILDTDGDGINDDVDACPTQAETFNGYKDTDGCPDTVPILDTDGDGINDDVDACPIQAENYNGYQDTDGCPDTVPILDTDGDGINDDVDACPIQAENYNGYQDTDGCPDTKPVIDTDKDGIIDTNDSCPTQAENYNGYQDTDGCPDTKPVVDSDSDGINDDVDACPTQAENYNGYQDTDGCPDTKPVVDSDGDGTPDTFDRCPNDFYKIEPGLGGCGDAEPDFATLLGTFGTFGSGNGQFDRPHGIVLHSGKLYVTDTGNNRVQIFDTFGEYIGKFGTKGIGDGQFNSPVGIEASDIFPGGWVLVTDFLNHRIQLFHLDGSYIGHLGTKGSDDRQFENPIGISIDWTGKRFISDINNHRVQIWGNPSMYLVPPGGGDYFGPFGIDFGYLDRVYIVDVVKDRVVIFDSSGKFFGLLGIQCDLEYTSTECIIKDRDGQFSYPTDISVYDNTIFVLDSGNNRIQIFDYSGKFLGKFNLASKGTAMSIEVVKDKIYVVQSTANLVEIYEWSYPQSPQISGAAPSSQLITVKPELTLDRPIPVESEIPNWVKNNAESWSSGQTEEFDFLNGVQHIMKEKIINISDLPQQASTKSGDVVPYWIKRSTGWWAEGLVPDYDFTQGLEYLIEIGIIQVEN